MDELKKKIHQMELENESLPEKVCVQLASEIEHQMLPGLFGRGRYEADNRKV